MMKTFLGAAALSFILLHSVSAGNIRGAGDGNHEETRRLVPTTNLATGGMATQSCTYSAASHAIDGNRDGDYANGSIAHTCDKHSNPIWWRVDLQDDGDCLNLSTVQVYNRIDCCQDRIIGANLQVLGTDDLVLYEHTIMSDGVHLAIPVPHEGCAKAVMITSPSPMTPIHLAEVQVFAHPKVHKMDLKYVGAKASQSCTLGSHGASGAVDGNYDGKFADGSLSHTCQDPAWWSVDLYGGECQDIDQIVIYNRVDCCQDRIEGALVEIMGPNGEDLGSTIIEHGDFVITLDMKAKCAKTVRVTHSIAGLPLTLAEVVVYDEYKNNIARGGKASQSCTNGNRGAELAVDGNPDGEINDNSLSMTCEDPSVGMSHETAWWRLDITNPHDCYEISKVVVYNREDCCQERIIGATVEVIGSQGKILAASTIESPDLRINVPFDSYKECAKAIMISASGPGVPLQLSEVEIYAKDKYHNLARDGVATQSCTAFDADASVAIDGNVNGKFLDHSVSHTCPDSDVAWWQVELATHRQCAHVTRVDIYNRQDCCQDRILGAKVAILSSSGKIIEIHSIESADDLISIKFSGQHCTKKVKILAPGKDIPLHFAEVEVFGELEAPISTPVRS